MKKLIRMALLVWFTCVITTMIFGLAITHYQSQYKWGTIGYTKSGIPIIDSGSCPVGGLPFGEETWKQVPWNSM